MEKEIVIDLGSVGDLSRSAFLSGKERGKDARAHFLLDEVEKRDGQIVIRIPLEIASISSSYSLGLFSESVSKFGSIEKFIEKYTFDGNPEIVERIILALHRGASGPPKLN